MVPLFLRMISQKSPPQSIKIFVKIEFFTIKINIKVRFQQLKGQKGQGGKLV